MSNTGLYDVNLLHAAPDASTAQKQAGYNVDLLAASQQKDGPPDDPVLSTSNHDPVHPFRREKDSHLPTRSPLNGTEEKVPFWRRKTGRIVLALLAIVIVGAVVGGAVGGVLSHKSKKSSGDNSGMGSDGSGNSSGSDTNQGTTPLTSSRLGQGVMPTTMSITP